MLLSFKGSVPDAVKESPDVNGLLTVLDALYTYKKYLINKGHRVYNPVLLTNKDYLRQMVNEQGYPEVPFDFPKIILDNMWLCAEDVMLLMGSKIGLKYLLRVLTCGNVTTGEGDFYPKDDYIVLSDLESGYLPSDQDIIDEEQLYLFDGLINFTGGNLDIVIATPFHNNQSIKDYINSNIRRFLGFSDNYNTITITFTAGPYVKNPYMFEYFSKVI